MVKTIRFYKRKYFNFEVCTCASLLGFNSNKLQTLHTQSSDSVKTYWALGLGRLLVLIVVVLLGGTTIFAAPCWLNDQQCPFVHIWRSCSTDQDRHSLILSDKQSSSLMTFQLNPLHILSVKLPFNVNSEIRTCLQIKSNGPSGLL